ncbi:hypothetical protein Emag_007378 [Eimeria magna]
MGAPSQWGPPTAAEGRADPTQAAALASANTRQQQQQQQQLQQQQGSCNDFTCIGATSGVCPLTVIAEGSGALKEGPNTTSKGPTEGAPPDTLQFAEMVLPSPTDSQSDTRAATNSSSSNSSSTSNTSSSGSALSHINTKTNIGLLSTPGSSSSSKSSSSNSSSSNNSSSSSSLTGSHIKKAEAADRHFA